MTAPGTIRFQTLGALDLTAPEGGAVRAVLAQPKRLALLAYLVMARPRGFQRRDALLALFWPDLDDAHARGALSRSLSHLRAALGEGAIVTRGDEEIATATERLWCDVTAFDDALDAGRLEDALALYRGDLLHGVFVQDAAGFEQWLETERDRLRTRAAAAATTLAELAAEADNLALALHWGRQATALSRYDEQPARRLIALLDRAGDRAAALRLYEELARQLREELDVEPAPETQALAAMIRARTEPSPAAARRTTAAPGAMIEPPPPGHAATAVAAQPRRTGAPRGAMIATAVLAVMVIGGLSLRPLMARRPPPPDHDLVAVLPFRVSRIAGDSSQLREGMVDLFYAKLGAVSGLRAVDSRTVFDVWRRAVPAGEDPSTNEAKRLAEQMGGGRLILGEIVVTRSQLSISARLLDTRGNRRSEAVVEGPADSLTALVDQLTSQLVAQDAGEPVRRLADLTSASLPALRAYLAGRAAMRRGEVETAMRQFGRALEIDTTFALASLGMASTGNWSQQSGQSEALRRGLRTGYALRERLPRRDQLLFEAYVLPNTLAAHSSAQQLAGWQRAAEAAPESPEALYEYGDRLYHAGAQLGIADAQALAGAQFARALALDSSFAQPLAHLLEIAARSGDRRMTRRLARLYRGAGAIADAGEYVRWQVARALGDQDTLTALRARLGSMSLASLYRMIGFGLVDHDDTADVDSAARELRTRVDEHRATPGKVYPAQTLHSWAMNRGRGTDIEHGIEALRTTEPIPSGTSIVYFDADQVPVLDALYWDGDPALAEAAAARLEHRTAGPPPRESGARARYYSDLCVVALHRDDDRGTAAMLGRLREGQSPRDSAVVYGGSPAICVALLDARRATGQHRPEAAALLARLDTLLAAAPYQFGVDFGNLALARLYVQRGADSAALRVIRRRPYDWDTGMLYLSTLLREEGRLAARTGDTEGARQAWTQYLALRAGSDPRYRALADTVAGELARLR